MYILINGDNTPYSFESIMPFTTQHGYNAIRIIGNTMPETDKGFKIYDNNDKVISDYSNYIYLYKDNEYSVEEDFTNLPTFTDSSLSPSWYTILNRKINKVNSKVVKITPYILQKTVGIDDTECIFDLYKYGNINVWMVTEDGEEIKCDYVITEDKIIVTFEPLTKVATIYVSIQ